MLSSHPLIRRSIRAHLLINRGRQVSRIINLAVREASKTVKRRGRIGKEKSKQDLLCSIVQTDYPPSFTISMDAEREMSSRQSMSTV